MKGDTVKFRVLSIPALSFANRMVPAMRIMALASMVVLAGCGGSHITFLDPQGPVAAQQRTHFLIIVGLMMVIVVPVLVLTPWLAWRYRYGSHHDYRPRWRFSWAWEIPLWGAPAAIVLILAVFLWRNTTTLDPYDTLPIPGQPLRVQVIGFDWKWLFVYPELGVASVDELAFPAGRQLALDLTSETVMQSFFIPALGSQVYAMAGMTTHLHLAADAPGRFRGLNTQYNGMHFDEQRFDAVALTPRDFAAWVAKARTEGLALDAAAYGVLARRGTARRTAETLGATLPLRFGAVSDGLFDHAVGHRHMPEPAR